MDKCDLCKREIGNFVKTWILCFYGIKNYRICKECNLSVEEQLDEWNLNYLYTKFKKEKC